MIPATVKPQLVISISLNRIRVPEGELNAAVRIISTQLLAYDQMTGYTRLRLTGGKVLEVRESTAQIDGLIRSAASGNTRI